MKITHIHAVNFLGARAVDVRLTKPVTIFTGANGAGKSSLQEAVRMALTGESVRVGLKKDYGHLVTDGADDGFADVEIDGIDRAFVTIPSGKTTPLTQYVTPAALPYVLDAQRFAQLDANDRRSFLFMLMGLSAGGAEVKKRLLAKGCNEQSVEAIMPMLRSGFDAAHKEAQAKARDEKAAWRTITGEAYGDKKAATWAAEKPAFDAAALADLQQRLTATDAELAAANQRMGAMQAAQKRHAEAAKRLAELRELAGRQARISDKLVRDEAELKAWEVTTESTRQRAAGGRKTGLVHDLAHALHGMVNEAQPLGIDRSEYVTASAVMDRYKSEHGDIADAAGHDPQAAATLAEHEKALRLLQSAVANGKRDLSDADAAARAVTELEAAAGTAPDDAAIKTAKDAPGELARKRHELSDSFVLARDAERKNTQAIGQTIKAQNAHQSVIAWLQIADALAPDGIPGEMLKEALGPLNKRLTQSSESAEWGCVQVDDGMGILYGRRPYALLSESEKWRADAMLAEAISYISKIKLLVLDRFDVLDLKGRDDLIAWLDIISQDNEIDTALLFGTLKLLPSNLHPSCEAFWIDSGEIVQIKGA